MRYLFRLRRKSVGIAELLDVLVARQSELGWPDLQWLLERHLASIL
jgi:hypothetical protein